MRFPAGDFSVLLISLLLAAPASAHDVRYGHGQAGHAGDYPGVHVYPGHGIAYDSSPYYRRGDKSHAWPKYRQKSIRKHLPSTHIYGYYPYTKYKNTLRSHSHSGTGQLEYFSGKYNRFPKRAYKRWYR
ncbi:MAG: hypothetical protein MI673_05010 [Thiotrichales bacterium]|nr:hypothetical protein [Thiotrichales bacterium]